MLQEWSERYFSPQWNLDGFQWNPLLTVVNPSWLQLLQHESYKVFDTQKNRFKENSCTCLRCVAFMTSTLSLSAFLLYLFTYIQSLLLMLKGNLSAELCGLEQRLAFTPRFSWSLLMQSSLWGIVGCTSIFSQYPFGEDSSLCHKYFMYFSFRSILVHFL